MSFRRADTDPLVGNVTSVGSVLPSLQNLSVVPTGTNNTPAQTKIEHPPSTFQLTIGVEKMQDTKFDFTRIKFKPQKPNGGDMYIWIKVSRIENTAIRGMIANAVVMKFRDFLERNGLEDVFNTHLDRVYEMSCSGVYETTHEFYTLNKDQSNKVEMLMSDLPKFADKLLNLAPNAQTTQIHNHVYNYNHVKTDKNWVVYTLSM